MYEIRMNGGMNKEKFILKLEFATDTTGKELRNSTYLRLRKFFIE